jgi:hypothetical protein
VHRFASSGLIAHEADLLRRGPDEVDIRRDARLREFRVLGEKPVTGMDRIGARDLGGGNDARDVEVRFARGRGPDADVVVGEADVERFPIGLGVDSDGLDAQLATGSDDAQSDFAAVRD